MRGPEERNVDVADLGLSKVPVHEFIAESEGAWQRFPKNIRDVLLSVGCDVVIKIGMGLLRDPDSCGVRLGVLSYHHGDPAEFRGRPAGFYEILASRRTMGIIVQRLSNRLDGGVVHAFARSRVIGHSYRKTLAAARRNSKHLLWQALDRADKQKYISTATTGKNHRLPGFWLSFKFLTYLAARMIRRIFYGMFIEKKWQVTRVDLSANAVTPSSLPSSLPSNPSINIPRGYVFLADSFYLPDGNIVAEAMRQSDGKGEIVKIDSEGNCLRLSDEIGRHMSYPFSFKIEGANYLLPEVASWSRPFLQEISPAGDFRRRYFLHGLEEERLIDPSWIRVGVVDYIFAGKPGSEADELYLWFSKNGIQGPYQAHPVSPIVVDATRARMGGGFLTHHGKCFRVGQDSSGSYGDGVTICEVTLLNEYEYEELPVRQLKVTGAQGPHTYVTRDSAALFDWYKDQFSFMAGLRRLRAKL